MTVVKLPIEPQNFPQVPVLGSRQHCPKASLSPQVVAQLHEAARSATPEDIKTQVKSAAWDCDGTELQVLCMAIDQDTGGSMYHTAVTAGRIDAMVALSRCFRADNEIRYRRVYEIIYTHRDRHGDTILHKAAQSGRQDLLLAAFRLFHGDWLPGEEGRGSYAPAEDTVGEEDEDEFRVPQLTYLLMENGNGRTAAQEARAQGHERLAVWLEDILDRSDPAGERLDGATVQAWREFCDEFYSYADTDRVLTS
ncbi:hypothetical protein B0I35DRAFT_481120 [Stachybotrys elegans]|uniref:Ankyrin repeat protein n=1 Tax=Stachybotrys elegans TaxID=80388 RepID=A0A8K0SRB4_9HYPO|nr:hypothetical protein B0I35DRAFT_481120 [Stachybotrys elegans]